ncbi:MAG: ATP-binding protein [Bacillota bacterium]|nr:ATP-binding protein [Bacillota bacterium]
MFHKLRLKLTLTNVAVVSVIFIIITAGIFFMTENNINNQTNQLLNTLASNEGLDTTQNISGHKGHDEHQFRYFTVKLNSSGNIISSSQNPDLNSINTNLLISNALKSKRDRGQIELDEETYLFQKSSSGSGQGMSIIFIDTHQEHEMLGDLMVVLALVGFGGLVLAFFGSLFMAERSLVPITESWKRQRDFVADASHELRTPLTVIDTTLELLLNRKEQTIESQIKWIENIQTENKRMTKLVNDLLFLARADSEQILLEKKDFPLHSALLEAYIPMESLAIQHGIHLEPFIGDEIDYWGDEARIKQLAVILVDNAIKYTPSGGSVKMSLKDIGTHAEIMVADTGEGIEKDQLNKIFQRFYRVDKARSRKEGSLGLGLSIAQWIVNEHHGAIKVESSKNAGTTFYITLPKTRH